MSLAAINREKPLPQALSTTVLSRSTLTVVACPQAICDVVKAASSEMQKPEMRNLFFSLLASRFSLLASRFSLLASRFSLLASRFSLLASRFSLLACSL